MIENDSFISDKSEPCNLQDNISPPFTYYYND